MIRNNHYRFVLKKIARELNKLVVLDDEGEDLKIINDKLIEQCRIGYELGLMLKGQEEKDD